ncbi:MAG: hypothetical protein JWO67_3175 [Streptosporangiaceae bacterium]|nr:hypothetical protein [Streptosporangiaceae bacterium]
MSWLNRSPEMELDPLAKRRERRRHGLHLIGIITLIFVSRGSYDTVVWAGGDKHWSLLYPVIVDLLVVLVMPASTDGTLPNTEKWPIRRLARATTASAFAAIVAFNALNSVIESMPLGWAPPDWARPTVAVVAGVVPVVLYLMGLALNTMTSGWEAETESDRIAAEQKRRQDRLDAAEQERRDEEDRVRKARERAAKRAANPDESPGESPLNSPQPAAANRNGAPANPQVKGPTLTEQMQDYIREQVAAGRGHELQPAELHARFGGHRSTPGVVLRRMRETGDCPPAGSATTEEEQAPQLSVVGARG